MVKVGLEVPMRSVDDMVALFHIMKHRIVCDDDSEPEFLYVGHEEYRTLLRSWEACRYLVDRSQVAGEPHTFMGVPLIEVQVTSHFNLVGK